MEKVITTAWAIRVDEAELVARVVTFFETRSVITSLEICFQNTQSAALSRFPTELLHLLIEQTEKVVYSEKLEGWQQARKCAEHKCEEVDHLLNDGRTLTKWADCWDVNGRLRNGPDAVHDGVLNTYIDTLTSPADRNDMFFSRYKRAFQREFGVLPLFAVLKHLDKDSPDVPMVEAATISGYLSVPISEVPFDLVVGGGTVQWLVEAEIRDPEALFAGMADNKESEFKSAVKALELDETHLQGLKLMQIMSEMMAFPTA